MYSSPATPGATGWRASSSTYTCVLATGVPMDDTSAAGPASTFAVDQTVVSVGPYRFVRVGVRPRIVRAKSGGSASAPIMARTVVQSTGSPSSAIRPRHRLGVACTMVTPAARISVRSAHGSSTCSCSARTTRAPVTSGR